MRRCAIASVFAALVPLASACSPPGPSNARSAANDPPVSTGAPADQRVAGALSAPLPASPAIVIMSPASPTEWPPQDSQPLMDQVNMIFTPGVLVVRTGQPVAFHNSDDSLHNINVADENTRVQAFNVAIPTGESYTYTFLRDGFYHVGCDIHQEMSAEIVSASTPFVALTDADGRFAFSGPPPGPYRIEVYAAGKTARHDVDVLRGVTRVTVAAP